MRFLLEPSVRRPALSRPPVSRGRSSHRSLLSETARVNRPAPPRFCRTLTVGECVHHVSGHLSTMSPVRTVLAGAPYRAALLTLRSASAPSDDFTSSSPIAG